MTVENEAPDCRCPVPKPDGRGSCATCGRFACEYADRGRTRCSPAICDCFIDTYPDSPRALHPEAFLVRTADGWFQPPPITSDDHPCHITEWHPAHDWTPIVEDPESPQVLHVGLASLRCPGVGQ